MAIKTADNPQDPLYKRPDTEEIPEEFKDAEALSQDQDGQSEEERREALKAFSLSIKTKIDEAINGRAQSGIETEWLEDEEHYQSIDAANRKQMAKPTEGGGPGGPVADDEQTRSTVFLGITRPYVDAAAARVGDMLLPTDDRPWGLVPTPIPDLIKAEKNNGILKTPDGNVDISDFVKKTLEKAMESAKLAERRIEDWHVECQWHAEVRKVIEDAARLGTGVLKGPVPMRRKYQAVEKDAATGTFKLVWKEEVKPGSYSVSSWNFFPDPACGENIQNGDYVVERDYLTGRKLRDLKGMEGYLDEEIDACLVEGPQTHSTSKPPRVDGQAQNDKNQYEVFYFTGNVKKSDLMAANCKCEENDPEVIPAIVTIVNGRAIKAVIQPLDNGDFPYDVFRWQRRAGSWYGTGVARQMRTPQRMVNAATRNLMDNAGLSSGPLVGIIEDAVEVMEGGMELRPRKVFKIKTESGVKSINDVISFANVPSMQVELLNIVQFGLKMAEDVTGLPMLLQGQQGKAPDTVGGMTILNNNASSVMRRIAKMFDDSITEPHIRRYYKWLLEFGEDENEKGEFVIDARGSSTLIERDMQNELIKQMGEIVLNPAFGADPEKWFDELLKSQKFDPKRIKMDQEKKTKIEKAQAEAQGKGDPRAQASIETANIRAGAEMNKAKVEQQTDIESLKLKLEDAERERQHDREMRRLDYEIKMMEFAEARQLSLDQVRADLAKTTITVGAANQRFAQEAELRRTTGAGI